MNEKAARESIAEDWAFEHVPEDEDCKTAIKAHLAGQECTAKERDRWWAERASKILSSSGFSLFAQSADELIELRKLKQELDGAIKEALKDG